MLLGVVVTATAAFLVVSDGGTDEREGQCADVLSELSEGEGRAGGLLRCLSPMLVFIETPLGTGSGIIIEDGYVVTNLHVIDPFREISVVVDGGASFEKVPVKGADPMTDIAVLGPIDVDSTGAVFTDHTKIEKGDELFLVGFPGEVGEEPEPAISKGILSRVREAREFRQTYLQTDAAIGGGQSGGALIDSRGGIVGISGLHFADQFALALSSRDIRKSINAILDGRTPEYRGFPEEPKVTSGTLSFASSEDVKKLVVHTSTPKTIRLTVNDDSRPWISVDSLDGRPLFVTREAVEALAEFGGVEPDRAIEDVEAIPNFEIGGPVAPGVFEFEVPEETFATIAVGTRRPEGAEMRYESSAPLVFFDDADQDTPMAIGDRVEGVMETLEVSDSFLVDLQAGQAVEIYAGSGPGDVSYAVQTPGQPIAEAPIVLDSNVGLTGLDAKDEYEADVDGRYRIFVFNPRILTTGYVLKVSGLKS